MPLKICAHPGCRVLLGVGTPRCKDHALVDQIERWARSDDRRADRPGRNLYRTRMWRDALRIETLRRDLWQCQWPGCGVPLLSGRTDPRSAVVDHFEPHEGDRVLFFDPDNTWSLCKMHHDGAKQAIEAAAKRDGVTVAQMMVRRGHALPARVGAAAR